MQGFLALFSGALTLTAFLLGEFTGARFHNVAHPASASVPETYAPALLRERAAHLSKVTGKEYRAPMDRKEKLQLGKLFKKNLSMPWILLFTEPIVMIISLYMAIVGTFWSLRSNIALTQSFRQVYGTLYMLFAAFPIVFQQGRGWNAGVGGLAFLGVLVGSERCQKRTLLWSLLTSWNTVLIGVAWVMCVNAGRCVDRI